MNYKAEFSAHAEISARIPRSHGPRKCAKYVVAEPCVTRVGQRENSVSCLEESDSALWFSCLSSGISERTIEACLSTSTAWIFKCELLVVLAHHFQQLVAFLSCITTAPFLLGLLFLLHGSSGTHSFLLPFSAIVSSCRFGCSLFAALFFLAGISSYWMAKITIHVSWMPKAL